ncbi:MAG TPA: UDP-N-acetylglucosamine 1-carboxyvinyltransferase [Candidatus Cryosericum sp.]|nr:UDP-N-acetylglucosamine 1-carboxyvinyltransferase [Candidatus Cryosericum sp.]
MVDTTESLIVEGGHSLHGTVRCSGAKNSILPLVAAAIAVRDVVTFQNVPDITDLRSLLALVEAMGVKVVSFAGGELTLDSSGPIETRVENVNGFSLRGTQTLVGALLGREHRAMLPSLGGCSIGARPIDLHIKGLHAMGTEFEWKDGYLSGHASALRACDVYLDFPSVGATENLLLAAALAEGTTRVFNAAQEPEVYDLISFLNKAGARIVPVFPFGFRVEGVRQLHGASHSVIGDRIEASTLMLATAITLGEATITGVDARHIWSIIAKLRETGATVEVEGDDAVVVKGSPEYRSTDIRTLTFPGFPTDAQPQMMAYLALAHGNSVIVESIFENRFGAILELERMGARIKVTEETAIVEGVESLNSAVVQAKDLRGGAALVLAGLAARGATTVKSIHHIDRGYEALDSKLAQLGARITRVV